MKVRLLHTCAMCVNKGGLTNQGFLPREAANQPRAAISHAAAKSGVELNSADNLEGMEFQSAKEEQRLEMGASAVFRGGSEAGGGEL